MNAMRLRYFFMIHPHSIFPNTDLVTSQIFYKLLNIQVYQWQPVYAITMEQWNAGKLEYWELWRK
jgi:hypothetical protein